MANKKYLDYAGLKRVLAKLLPGARKIWHGTEDEWNQLTAAERDKYDQAEIVGVTQDMAEVLRNPDWSRAIVVPNNGKAGWTAPEDGLIVGGWGGNQAETTSGIIDYLKVNDVIVASSYRYPNNNGIQIPVNKGDVFSESGGTAAYWNVFFVPYKVNVVDNRFPANYMGTEQFTGKYWVDGKKIYRRTIQFMLPSTASGGAGIDLYYKGTSTPIKYTDWNADKITSCVDGVIDSRAIPGSAEYRYLQRPLNYSINTADFCNVIFHVESKLRVWFAGSHNLNAECHLTVEYTKTTD